MCPNRLYAFVSITAACAALATPAAVQAQSSMDLPDDMSIGGGVLAQPQGRQARSVFLGTIAALLAQGVGTALSQGLAGSITRWFDRSNHSEPPARAADMPATRVAGVAYEVHLVDERGASRAVDPARHVFHTGDVFRVHYRPALPGRVTVSNVDPRGQESRIDRAEVAAGQLATLGPYRFVDKTGRETLKLTLEPCSTPALVAASRGIVKANEADAGSSAPLRIGSCGDALARGVRAKARSIAKASIDGPTAYAMDPLGRDELASGRIEPRELVIPLQHR